VAQETAPGPPNTPHRRNPPPCPPAAPLPVARPGLPLAVISGVGAATPLLTAEPVHAPARQPAAVVSTGFYPPEPLTEPAPIPRYNIPLADGVPAGGAWGEVGGVTHMSRSIAPPTTCPDCNSPLERIQVLEQTRAGWPPRRAELTYAAGDAQASWIQGGRPVEGVIRSWVCTGCGRVLLYAVPSAAATEVSPASAPEGRGDEASPAG
jgi:hypothetical protein